MAFFGEDLDVFGWWRFFDNITIILLAISVFVCGLSAACGCRRNRKKHAGGGVAASVVVQTNPETVIDIAPDNGPAHEKELSTTQSGGESVSDPSVPSEDAAGDGPSWFSLVSSRLLLCLFCFCRDSASTSRSKESVEPVDDIVLVMHEMREKYPERVICRPPPDFKEEEVCDPHDCLETTEEHPYAEIYLSESLCGTARYCSDSSSDERPSFTEASSLCGPAPPGMEPCQQRGAGGNSQTLESQDSTEKSIKEMEAGWPKSPGDVGFTVNKILSDWPVDEIHATAEDKSQHAPSNEKQLRGGSRGDEKELELIIEYSQIKFRKHEKEEILYGSAVDTSGFGSGLVHLTPGSREGVSRAEQHNFVFLVLDGTVQVNIHESERLCRAGDFITVPKGSEYDICGRGDKVSALAYFKWQGDCECNS